ncbi:MAG: hypothetical protein V4535_08680 [Bacteroidota bacterium]
MKKLFLFVSAVALTVTLNSCSSDDEDGGDSISFKIGGVTKSFNTIVAAEGGGTVFVSAYNGTASDPGESVSFTIPSGETGANRVDNFSYTSPGGNDFTGNPLTSDVTTNSGSLVKGTFSGTLDGGVSTSDLVMTDGKFDITY